MKKIRNITNVTLILILSILLNILNSIETTEAKQLNNINNSMYLNPKWIEYSDLSEEEKQKYQVVPEKYLIKFNEKITEKPKFNGIVRGAETLSYYNLMDKKLVTPPRDQGNTGLCWAFAAISSVESNLLINDLSNKENPITFSERQLDYATASKDYIYERYSPYYASNRESLGTGTYVTTPFEIFALGVSPIATEKFGKWNENLTSKKSITQVLNTNLVDYKVDGFYLIGGVDSTTSSAVKQSYVQAIKNHVATYGSVTIGTIGPQPATAGSCLYFDAKNGKYLLNVSGNCNPSIKENGHAMSIIGWDDNYEYKYCRTSSSTNNNLTNCSNIVSGKGAFILKNSWGDNISYPYLAYTSNVDSAIGITGTSEKNWSTNYESRRSIDYTYNYSTSIINYKKSSKVKEQLKKITFYHLSESGSNTYNIYISKNNGTNYTKIGSVFATYIGLYNVDISNYILDTDNFSIKITSNNGTASQIYAFTDYVDENTDIVVDTKILSGNEYGSFIANLELVTVTRNIPSGKIIQYQLLDEDGVDISSLMTVENNIVLNNAVTPLIKFSERINSSKVILNTIYEGKVISSDTLNINKIENYFEQGTGSEEEPIIINNIEEFFNIGKSEYLLSLNYKLGSDLDFSNINDYNTITNFSDGVFTGTFDGNNHLLTGLNCSSNWCSIFYKTENAIIKNLTISNFKITSTNSINSNLAFLAYESKYTKFSNITILDNSSITTNASFIGSLVSIAYDSYFYHISNYSSIESTSTNNEGYIGGILGKGYGCKIEESYNNGDINAQNAISGGLAGIFAHNTNTGMNGDIINSYNRGNINSNNISGGLIGEVGNSIISTTYSTSSLKRTCDPKNGCFYGNLFGVSYANCFKDLYWLKNNSLAYYYYNDYVLERITDENTWGLTEEQLKDRMHYPNFDFENVWAIDNDYPFLKNNHYSQITNIILPTDISLRVDEKQKVELEIIPTSAKINQVKITIENEEIVSIDDNLNITGLKEGSTNILVDTIDGSNLHYNILVTVTEEEKLTIQNYEIIEENYILIDEFINKEELLSNINIPNKNYKIDIIGKKEIISTGDIVNIYYKEELIDSYILSVLGDVTGSGSVNIGDIAKTFQYIKEKITMEREYQIAADTTLDNKIKLNDIIKSFQYIKGKIESLGDE